MVNPSRNRRALVASIVTFAVFNLLLSWYAGLTLYELETPTNNLGQHLNSFVSPPPVTQQKKKQRNQQDMPPRESSSQTAGFVHIGKTGGSTISQLLRHGCTSFVEGPCHNITNESAVSKIVEHYYHVVDFHRLPQANHRTFIISVRDVYDRTVSSFLYHHPGNVDYYKIRLSKPLREHGPMAYECFKSVEILSQRVVPQSQCVYPHDHNVVNTENCTALACGVMQGKIRFFPHLFFNYQNILYTKLPTTTATSSTTAAPDIYVLRQEHLWSDWDELNRLFGQKDPIVIPSGDGLRNISGLTLPVTRDVSSEGRARLCEALLEEYEAYFRILVRAVNMPQSKILECLAIANKNCPGLSLNTLMQTIQQEESTNDS